MSFWSISEIHESLVDPDPMQLRCLSKKIGFRAVFMNLEHLELCQRSKCFRSTKNKLWFLFFLPKHFHITKYEVKKILIWGSRSMDSKEHLRVL